MRFISVICALIIGSALSVNSVAEEATTISTGKSNDQSNLIIYRPADPFALNYRVVVDGNYVGKLKRDRAFGLVLPEGDHAISLNDADHTSITVNVTKGAITYVRKDVGKNAVVGLMESWLADWATDDLTFINDVAILH